MKIHITKSGKIIVVCAIIGVAIFFMCGGCAVISKLVENHRVSSIPSIANRFESSDISYDDMRTLRNSFLSHYEETQTNISRLRELQKSYPNNEDVKNKLNNYGEYLDSMKNSSFDCPEHINKGSEGRSKKCPDCWNWSSSLFWRCGTCGGTNEIKYTVNVNKNCPHCGTNYKSQISANSLLK